MKEERAIVYVKGTPAAVLTRHSQAGAWQYELQYLPEYLEQPTCHTVCYQMPPRQEAYHSGHLFPFFESLLPEGENLERINVNYEYGAAQKEISGEEPLTEASFDFHKERGWLRVSVLDRNGKFAMSRPFYPEEWLGK